MADVLRATRPVAIAPPGFRRPHDRLSFLIRRSTARDSGSPLRLSLPDLSTIDRHKSHPHWLQQLLLIHGGPNALAQPQNPPHWSLPSNCSPFVPFDPRSKSCSTSCVHLCQRRTSTTSCWTCLPAGPYVVHHRCISPGITNRRSSLFMTSPSIRALSVGHHTAYSARREADFVMPSVIRKYGSFRLRLRAHPSMQHPLIRWYDNTFPIRRSDVRRTLTTSHRPRRQDDATASN